MSVLQSALLGIIQGLGEFLPISSSGHLLLARIFLGIQTESPAMKMLDILLHVGTLVPVLIIFRREWLDMILHPVRNKTLLLLVIASVPTLAVYLAAKKIFPAVNGFAVFDSGWFLGFSFLITAFFLLLCDRIAARGRSGSCFIFRKSAAWASPSSCRIVMYEMGVESKVDSRREQRKDTAIAPRRKVRRSAILYRRIRPTVQVGNWGPYPSWKTGCGENFP